MFIDVIEILSIQFDETAQLKINDVSRNDESESKRLTADFSYIDEKTKNIHKKTAYPPDILAKYVIV